MTTRRRAGGHPGRSRGSDISEEFVAELGRVERRTAARHDELRREKARVETVAARRHDELSASLRAVSAHISRVEREAVKRLEALAADVVHAEVEAMGRHEELRADITTHLTRLERLQRDSLAHRMARMGRGLVIVLRSLVHEGEARNLLRGARVLARPDGRRTWSQLFDSTSYLDAYPDVAKANMPAALHYLVLGYRQGRRPSSHFSGEDYLRAHPDVAEADVNPLVHYALWGQPERRHTDELAPALPVEIPSGIASQAMSGPDQQGSNAVAPDRPPEPTTRVNTSWPDRYPLVSVVIPAYNYGQSLGAAVKSVLTQTWEDTEIIVIESDSTDLASAAAIRELEAQRPPRTTFFYRDGRRLVGDNRNFGINRARGRYVVCLDADDTLEPTYLEAALFLAEAYQYDLVYPSVQCVGRTDGVWPARDTTFEELLETNSISVAALFRRSAWVESGGYRDWGLVDALVPEDWAFWTRLVGMGYRAKAIRSPCCGILSMTGARSRWPGPLSQRGGRALGQRTRICSSKEQSVKWRRRTRQLLVASAISLPGSRQPALGDACSSRYRVSGRMSSRD